MKAGSLLRRIRARWQKANPRQAWEREYRDPRAREKWASRVRLGFYEFAAELLPRKPLRILDVGSGFGYGGNHLMEMCDLWQVEGFELSRAAVDEAIIPSRQGDLLRDPLPTDFDYLLLIQTLEHFRHPAEILARVVPVARQGILITTPYKGPINRKHLCSIDESLFRDYPGISIDFRKRVYEKDGSLKTDMRVFIPASPEVGA